MHPQQFLSRHSSHPSASCPSGQLWHCHFYEPQAQTGCSRITCATCMSLHIPSRELVEGEAIRGPSAGMPAPCTTPGTERHHPSGCTAPASLSSICLHPSPQGWFRGQEGTISGQRERASDGPPLQPLPQDNRCLTSPPPSSNLLLIIKTILSHCRKPGKHRK